MYKIKMFILWVIEKLTSPFSGDDWETNLHREVLYIAAYVYFFIAWVMFFIQSLIVIPFILLWFVSAALAIPHLMGLIRSAVKKQYLDYQAFVINGGKQKPKNDE